jgi:NADH-quinone oxidoreductase subunit M
MEWFETWGLTLIVFLPLVGALLLGFIPKENESALKTTGLVATVLTFVASLALIGQFDFAVGTYNLYQFEVSETWIGAINANYHLGVDGISLPLLVLSTFVMVLAVIYSWNNWDEPKNPKAFLILMMVLATGMNGTFVALDLVLFFIFFEVVLLPMYFMIGIWGDKTPRKVPGFAKEFETRLYASIKFFLGRAGPSAEHSLSSCSGRCSWGLPSRCPCGRSTPGCPTLTPLPRRWARCFWPPSC